MKKWAAILMACLLLTGAVMAEGKTESESAPQTRQTIVMMEGMEEEIQETLFDSGLGYSIWYEADRLVPSEQYGHVTFVPVDGGEEPVISLMIVQAEIAKEQAEAFLGEAVGGYEPTAEISEPVWETLENGVVIGTVDAMEEGRIDRFYLVMGGDQVLCITATYPLEAAEGFGVRFDRMVKTIGFDAV